MPVPTFDEGPRAAQAQRLPVCGVPLLDNLEADLEALRAACEAFAGRSIVYLCNPNNPTGTVVSSADLREWVLGAPDTFFLLDEAYVDFVTDPRILPADAWVREGLPNVTTLRTFSKLHGLAGLRVGYSLSAPAQAQKWAAYSSDLPANTLGLLAARASLADTEFQQRSRETVLASRAAITGTLQRLGLRYAAPNGNFVFYELPAWAGTNSDFRERMHALHIRVGRDFTPYERWNRLSTGTAEETAHVTAVLTELLSQA